MAHLSPRTKVRVQQINVFKKATGRSRRMVTAELLKKAEPPAPPKKRTPLKGSGTTIKNVCPVPASPRPIKRTRADDHVYDSSGAPEVRRSVVQRNGVVPAVAAADTQPKNLAALDSVNGLHKRTSLSPSKENLPRRSPVRLASVIERPTVATTEELPLPNGVVPNGYHPKAAEANVQMERCSAHSPVIEAYRIVDNSVTCADGHSSPPPTIPMLNCAASPQAIGFENLLRRVGSPEPACPTSVRPSIVSTVTELNGDSDALTLRPAVQTGQRRPASPEHVPAPVYFHGLFNLGNTCYMNTVIQLLYNLECFSSDVPRPMKIPTLRSDGIFLALRQVFQLMAQGEAHHVISPISLQQSCQKYMTDFEGSVQQDAQEFLLNVLDKIEEEIALGQREEWEASQTVPADRESVCPTTRNFSCQVRNILSCEGCDNIVNVEQSSRLFSLPLPEDRRDPQAEVPDIEALMNIYFQVETLSRKCEKCGAATMKSETKIVQLPRVLILHINRFEIDRHMLCSKVSVPEIGAWKKCGDPAVRGYVLATAGENLMDIFQPWKIAARTLTAMDIHQRFLKRSAISNIIVSPRYGLKVNPSRINVLVPAVWKSHIGKMFAGKENGFVQASSTNYSLHGVVSHVGKLASCGHYTVDIHDVESSKYVRCDDAVVREVSSEDVFCEEKFKEAYVLLYVLQNDGDQRRRE